MKKTIIIFLRSVLAAGLILSLALLFGCSRTEDAARDEAMPLSSDTKSQGDGGAETVEQTSGDAAQLSTPRGIKVYFALGIASCALFLIALFLIFFIETSLVPTKTPLIVLEYVLTGVATLAAIGAAGGYLTYFLGNVWLVLATVLAAASVIVSALYLILQKMSFDSGFLRFFAMLAGACLILSIAAFAVHFAAARLLILGILALFVSGIIIFVLAKDGSSSLGGIGLFLYVLTIALFLLGTSLLAQYIFGGYYYGLALGSVIALAFSEMMLSSDLPNAFSIITHGACIGVALSAGMLLGVACGAWASVGYFGVLLITEGVMFFIDRVVNIWSTDARQALAVPLMPVGFFLLLSSVLAAITSLPLLSLGIGAGVSVAVGTAFLIWYALHKKYGIINYKISNIAAKSLMITGLSWALLSVVLATVFLSLYFIF